ncbi:hypothetical protein NLG97_g533 [Lecanicillium saksenae]|uniref:Uncharacterized protein n=1 Tax=Lecanicillium saksenae TaxID=468837 RepID=A0ACC1R816_9HYPO|nr:hypothetical protein NLG97_g533 [Lecanicillium saksenae]
MPRTGYKSDKYLTINPDKWQAFEPGDVISGRVQNEKQIKGGVASVTVRLVGRAKTKIAVKMEHGSSFYRNRFNFFDESEASWVLFEDSGPSDANSPNSWQFKAQIPRTMSPSAIAADGKSTTSFLPLDSQTVAQSVIPDIFHYTKTGSWSGTTLACYVEYYMVAELRTPKNKCYTATLPLVIYSPASPGPLSAFDFGFQLTSDPFSVCQKPKAFWNRSKDAGQACHLEIYYPTRLQLGSKMPLQLRVAQAKPEFDSDSCAPDLQIRLDSLKVTIKSVTTGICKGTFSPKKMAMTEKYVVESKSLLPSEMESIFIPTAQGVQPLDLGELLELMLEHDGITIKGARKGKEFKPSLSPDLTTFCITHAHQLIWDLRVEICGTSQFHKTQVTSNVQIDGPSRQTMEQNISQLTDEERKAKFKAAGTAAELGLEVLNVTKEIIEAFS